MFALRLLVVGLLFMLTKVINGNYNKFKFSISLKDAISNFSIDCLICKLRKSQSGQFGKCPTIKEEGCGLTRVRNNRIVAGASAKPGK